MEGVLHSSDGYFGNLPGSPDGLLGPSKEERWAE